VWNGKTWFKQLWISEATQVSAQLNLISLKGQISQPSHDNLTKTLYPKTHFPATLLIKHEEYYKNYEKIMLKIISEETTITEDFELKKYLNDEVVTN
jgi:hypothetical protein